MRDNEKKIKNKQNTLLMKSLHLYVSWIEIVSSLENVYNVSVEMNVEILRHF